MKDINKKPRLKFRYKILIISILIITTFLIYARYFGTKGLEVHEYKITNNNVPTSFHGLKIVHISDIHYGRTIKLKELKDIIKQINIIRPDIVVFTGDLIDKDIDINYSAATEITKELKNIHTKLGKYAITGNHDEKNIYFNDIINNSDFILLDNSYDIIYNESNDPIYISGIENMVNGNINIDKAFEYQSDIKSSYSILLLHTPDYIDNVINKYYVDLALAGHSHNGQIRLPFIGALITPYGAKEYYKPYYKTNNTDMYISSGIGTSNNNFRSFNKPSFNFYRITKK
jgi:uncharacterized protein